VVANEEHLEGQAGRIQRATEPIHERLKGTLSAIDGDHYGNGRALG
jgi:hypothetical protein